MADLGLRPKGTGPGVLETMISGASKFMTSYQEAKEKEGKKTKERADTYMSLRKAGYSKRQAFDALDKGIKEVPESDYLDADTELKKAKIGYYKRKGTDEEKASTPSKLKSSIKMKIFRKEKLDNDEYEFAMREGVDVPDVSTPTAIMSDTQKPKQEKYSIDKAKNWQDVPFLQRVISAATPSATKEEKKLGGLRLGGIFKPPKEKGTPKGTSGSQIERARAYIKSKRGKATDEDVHKFLQKYPDFK